MVLINPSAFLYYTIVIQSFINIYNFNYLEHLPLDPSKGTHIQEVFVVNTPKKP